MNCGRSPNYNKDSLNMLLVTHFSQKNFIRRLSIDILEILAHNAILTICYNA